MPRIIPAIALLLAAASPAVAQSFDPIKYGTRYCELRSLTLSQNDASRVAMTEAWSDTRPPKWVVYKGQRIMMDVLDAARYVSTNCPMTEQ
jgi:hypothetical protein